jgi:squamous cell carcinoma antigen recognized by T-cells 3
MGGGRGEADLASTWAAYEAFEQQRAPDAATAAATLAAVAPAYKRAGAEMDARRPFEAAAAAAAPTPSPADDTHLTSFLQYIDYEGKQKPLNAFRVRALYERAVLLHPLRPELWARYTDWLDRALPAAAVVLPVHARALRACPWAGDLWANGLRALERLKQPAEAIDGRL